MAIRKILYLSVFVGFIFIFQTGISVAQTNYILGVVKDSKGKPIEGAKVFEVLNKDAINDITDNEGLYCVRIPKNSPTYQLQCEKEGFITHVDAEPISNNVDPKKRYKIILLGPNDLKTFSAIQFMNIIKVQSKTLDFGKQSKIPTVLRASKSNFELMSDNINPNLKDRGKIEKEISYYIKKADRELNTLQR